MKVSIIAAHDMMRVIGFEGSIPWHISADLKRFKELTLGKAVIMGRKTFESIGRPLSGRINVIMTSKPDEELQKWVVQPWYDPSRIFFVPSYQTALEACVGRAEHVFVIGGSSVYEEAMKTADDMYITIVYHAYKGDAYFPPYNCSLWSLTEVAEVQADEDDETPDYAFYYLERRTGAVKKFLGRLVSSVQQLLKRP